MQIQKKPKRRKLHAETQIVKEREVRETCLLYLLLNDFSWENPLKLALIGKLLSKLHPILVSQLSDQVNSVPVIPSQLTEPHYFLKVLLLVCCLTLLCKKKKSQSKFLILVSCCCQTWPQHQDPFP